MSQKKSGEKHEFDKELHSVSSHATFYSPAKLLGIIIVAAIIVFGIGFFISSSTNPGELIITEESNAADVQEEVVETPIVDVTPEPLVEDVEVVLEEEVIQNYTNESVESFTEEEKLSLTSSCMPVDISVECNSEFPEYGCENLQDADNTTQWFASYSCTTGRKPCAVSNTITVSSNEDVNQLILLNRIERDFYINRVQLIYENSSEFIILGSEFSQKPFTVNLSQNTSEFQVHIVEIVGLGTNYLSGLAEVSANYCS